MSSAKKLKILHLTSHLDVGGITRYIQLLGQTQIKRGHDVSVLSSGGALESIFEKSGLRTHRFSIRKKNILDPSLYFHFTKIERLIREEKYDLLHAHTRVTQALSFFLGRKTKTPVISTCHGFFKYKLGRKLFPFWGGRVVAISRPVANALEVDHKVPVKKIRVVGNAINFEECVGAISLLNAEEIRRRYSIPPGALVVTAVGRFVQDKGHGILVRAVASLLPTYPELFLLMVGSGREKENLQKVIAETRLMGRVLILEGVQDVLPVLAATDIFVHPAFYREGFGLGIAEAMACGKPVVITDIPAVNTIFRPGECCVMAKPADVQSLAGAIRFLIEAPGEKKKIAEAGQEFVRTHCSPERMADEMDFVYREVLAS